MAFYQCGLVQPEEKEWEDQEDKWEGDALRVEGPLAEEDFAGRYAIQFVVENGDMWRPQQDRAYVEITKRGTPSPPLPSQQQPTCWLPMQERASSMWTGA